MCSRPPRSSTCTTSISSSISSSPPSISCPAPCWLRGSGGGVTAEGVPGAADAADTRCVQLRVARSFSTNRVDRQGMPHSTACRSSCTPGPHSATASRGTGAGAGATAGAAPGIPTKGAAAGSSGVPAMGAAAGAAQGVPALDPARGASGAASISEGAWRSAAGVAA
eukprot:scaffold45525_cov19-Tisochrysis_lutea.AAC.1